MRLPTFSLALIAALASGMAQANTLLQVYDHALQQDATYRAAQHARDAALQIYPQARASVLPQLNASYSYSYSDSETQLSGSPAQSRSGPSRGFDLTLSQTLFDWSAFKRLDLAGQQVALAEAQFRIAGQELLLRVADAYFGVLAAQDTLRSAQAENEAISQQLELARERFEVGLAAITDVQEAQARADLTVAQLIDAERAQEAAREALAEITTQRQLQVSPLTEEIPLPAPNPASVDEWVRAATDHNLALLSRELSVAAAEASVEVARGARLPTVGARASYSDSRTETGAFPSDTTNQNVGVSVSLPLFTGLATRSRISESRSLLDQRLAERDLSRRQVERQTRDAYQAVIAGAARVRALNQATLSSRTALEASETGLEVGTRTAIDVLNAQQQLFAAERNALRARYDYLLAGLALKQAAGRLQRADLEAIEALLVTP